MISIHADHTLTFSLFDQFPQLLCKLSTKRLGNLDSRRNEKLLVDNSFYSSLPAKAIRMEQIHADTVSLVKALQSGDCVVEADGLVTRDLNTFLCVTVADCIPLFLYDPKNNIVALAHSGWRGTLKNIVQKLVALCIQEGSHVEDLYGAIGPHIGACCYEVSPTVAALFTQKFKERVVFENCGKWYVDLGQAVRTQLVDLGLSFGHIDASVSCTNCQNNLYFSYRRDKKDEYGQMVGVIGIKSL